MKVGIITFHRSANYGSLLQTYALQQAILGLGHEVEVIDYHPPHRENFCRISHHRLIRTFPFKLLQDRAMRDLRDFTDRHLRLSERTYRDAAELVETRGRYDAIVAGSDQIWNPDHFPSGLDPAYFLNFVDSSTVRVAYAPSIGLFSVADPAKEQKMMKLLRNFDHLSLRETVNVEQVRQSTGRAVFDAMDPTALVGDWSTFIRPERPRRRYVLIYSLNQNPRVARAAKLLARKYDVQVLSIRGLKFWKTPGKTIFPGFAEWVNLFHHAEAVVTNSYHGTLFSLYFQKRFIYVDYPKGLEFKNSRIFDIFAKVGLEPYRIGEEVKLETLEGAIERQTDTWPTVERRLAERRKDSLAYLSRSLTPAARSAVGD